MRELLVIMVTLSVVSSDDFELPPEVDPNFWPVRGRRSYWALARGNFFQDDERSRLHSNRESSRYSSMEYGRYPETQKNLLKWQSYSKKMKFPFPLIHYSEPNEPLPCNERCLSIRGRREDEGWMRQKPFYVDEPGWIEIDYNHDTLGRSSIDTDPFFVARGKKQNGFSPFDFRERRVSNDVYEELSSAGPIVVERKKRNVDKAENKDASDDIGASLKNRPGRKLKSKFSRNKLHRESGYPTNYEVRSEPKHQRIDAEEAIDHVLFESKLGEENLTSGQRGKRFDEWKETSEKSSMDHSKVKEEIDSGEKQRIDISLTKGLEDWGEEQRHRTQRLLSSILKKEDEERKDRRDGTNTDSSVPKCGVEDHDSKVNHSRARQKHSNLQNILEGEPFFISRGKKGVRTYLYDKVADSDDLRITMPVGGEDLEVPEINGDVEDETEDRQLVVPWTNREKIDFKEKRWHVLEKPSDIVARLETADNDDSGSLSMMIRHCDPVQNEQTRHKTLRRHRDILEDFLSNDDPSYVAPGKRGSSHRCKDSPVRYVTTIEWGNSNKRKMGVFAKYSHMMLRQKLYNFTKSILSFFNNSTRKYPMQSWNFKKNLNEIS